MIRDAMLAEGIDAVSCDLQPSAKPGPHIQGDVTDHLRKRWTGVIAHPDCTYLANSGAKHLYVGMRKHNPDGTQNGMCPVRVEKVHRASEFYRACKAANAPKVAVENPIMHRLARDLTKAGKRQILQPWQFGDRTFKATGFEVKGLPDLVPTHLLTPPKKGTKEHDLWSWVWRMPPGPDRKKLRSRTQPGIARAIAQQWGAA